MRIKICHLLGVMMFSLPLMVMAAEEPVLPKAPIDIQDQASLQRGAQLFVNYCLSCHSASMMRYNRLTDIGLTEDQIKKDLMFTTNKVGDQMNIAMDKQDAKSWFGAAPPDLTLIARSRGADYLYAYMRSFYRDSSRDTGWNNLVFDKVGMPHVLWELQGEQVLKITKGEDGQEVKTLVLVKPGDLTRIDKGKVFTREYDNRVRDLVNFMVYMAEPKQEQRRQVGYVVMLFLGLVLFPLVYFLKKEYWKDIH